MPKYNYSQYQNVPITLEVTVGEVKDLVRILQEAGDNAKFEVLDRTNCSS